MKSKIKIKKRNPPLPSSLLLRATAGEERSKKPNPLRLASSEASKRAEIKRIKKIEEIKIMATKDILEKAKKELVDLTGFKSPSAVGFKKEGNELIATIEVIEKESIPDGMDVLGTYEVRVDDNGKIISYERTDLRKRVDTTLNKEA